MSNPKGWRPGKSCDGFTIIELLVVVGILVLLSGMLLPAVKRARDSAKSAACMANLRQIGVAMQAYLSDNSGYYPWDWGSGPPSGFGGQWDYAISPYLGGSVISRPAIFVCPARTIATGLDKSTYSIHQGICPDVNTWSPLTPAGSLTSFTKATTMYRPSETILVADAIQQGGANGGNAKAGFSMYGWATATDYPGEPPEEIQPGWLGVDQDAPADADAYNLRYRHNGYANCLFCDGHVQSALKGTLKAKNIRMGHPPGSW